MSIKYRYQKYLNKAFWNSLLITLIAVALLLLLVYVWIAVQSFVNDRLSQLQAEQNDQQSSSVTDDLSTTEKQQILDELAASSHTELSEEEKMKILDELAESNEPEAQTEETSNDPDLEDFE